MAGRPCAESIPRRWPVNKVKIILFILIGTGAWAGLLGSQTIFEAAKKGDIAALKAIIATNPGLVNAPGENGRSPLQEAIWAKQTEAARFLIEAGADVNWPVGQNLIEDILVQPEKLGLRLGCGRGHPFFLVENGKLAEDFVAAEVSQGLIAVVNPDKSGDDDIERCSDRAFLNDFFFGPGPDFSQCAHDLCQSRIGLLGEQRERPQEEQLFQGQPRLEVRGVFPAGRSLSMHPMRRDGS